MTYLNPLIAPVAQGTQAQRAAAAEKVARTQALSKNSAAEGDRFEHAVESADALTPVGGDPSKGNQQRPPRRRRPDASGEPGPDGGGEAHLDVKA